MVQSARDNRKPHLAAGIDIVAPHEAVAPQGPHGIAPRSGPVWLQSDAEMLGEFQALRLVVGADALTVHRIRPRQHFLVNKTADDLPMLENERHFARAHFQNRTRTFAAGTGIAEAGIEEA